MNAFGTKSPYWKTGDFTLGSLQGALVSVWTALNRNQLVLCAEVDMPVRGCRRGSSRRAKREFVRKIVFFAGVNHVDFSAIGDANKVIADADW